MKIGTALAPLTVAGLLAGCAIPASKAVVEPVSATALGLAPDAAPVIASDWWRSFGDPQLDRLVRDAVAGSPSLDAALARVAQAQAVLSTRRADNGPDVTLDAQEQLARLSGRYTIPPPYAGSTRFVGSTAANLSWNLDLFGRQKAAIEGARASVRAASLDVAAARMALSGAVVQTYIDLERAEAQAGIARRTIATRQNSLRLVNVRIRNNLASKLDAQAATTLLAQARQALLRAQAAQVLAKNALAALAGRGADYPATIGLTALRLDAALPLPKTVPADLLARRADIAAAQARIEAAAAGRQVARKAFYPNVNLAALAGFQAVGLGNLFSLDAGTVGVGPAVHLPIFDNGRLKADLAGATAAVDLATADYNDWVIGAVREAGDAVARIGALDADRQRQREVVRGYAETGRLNAIRVSSGLDSRLDLVDNDVRTLAAEQADADLAADAAQQRVQLVLALGGGYDFQGMTR
ncbi:MULTISPECIES: efflux transporter outer membrane subunit [unclassified Sphingomonas]|uniref:efflux transporter outer membrane subunit n=1 Tax=unclassified Sphingomonas TaxID=196159 RepID=UPI000E772774|nr:MULTISPECIES: efflux transporter outer membrane subunit [unclassified Sphingomonas]RKE49893.1 NodT family efflux transporter outer membrane factor (OMF) lipoprotein [Sphingomonas sp. PP-CC-1A-547]TCM08224.1 NodT family efflux transporter outer membrane factor (OMF) lipoprotein [Sphingomonas sp. PP-CC-3G-468]